MLREHLSLSSLVVVTTSPSSSDAQASRSVGAYNGIRPAFRKGGPPPTTASLARVPVARSTPHFSRRYAEAAARRSKGLEGSFIARLDQLLMEWSSKQL